MHRDVKTWQRWQREARAVLAVPTSIVIGEHHCGCGREAALEGDDSAAAAAGGEDAAEMYPVSIAWEPPFTMLVDLAGAGDVQARVQISMISIDAPVGARGPCCCARGPGGRGEEQAHVRCMAGMALWAFTCYITTSVKARGRLGHGIWPRSSPCWLTGQAVGGVQAHADAFFVPVVP